MNRRRYRRWLGIACLMMIIGAPLLQGLQRWRRSMPVELPPDADEETEFYFVRLAYQGGGRGGRRWGGAWTTDSPEAERHFLQGVRRLTAIHARSVEKYIRPLDPELFDHPWIYAVEVGYWYLNDEEAARMREYLLRGGFLIVDDFHGAWEWASFLESMRRVFLDRSIVEIVDSDPVFHMLYDVDHKIQIPGIHYP